MKSALRPDRSGVVIEINAVGNMVAHCSPPMAWKREPMRTRLVASAAMMNVLIDTGQGALLLHRTGETEALVFVDVDPLTNARRYARAGYEGGTE